VRAGKQQAAGGRRLGLGLLMLLVACDPNTTRPRITPFPEDPSIEVRAKIPPATERLIRALTVDSIPIAFQSLKDGWVETPWLNAATLKPTDARPIGTDVVRIRGWVDPGKEGFSIITVEGAYRPFADPSLPGRELERPLPKDHPVQVKLDSMLARIPKGRSNTAVILPPVPPQPVDTSPTP
jgi:hypothetical protein